MEQQVLEILASTLDLSAALRKEAELRLQSLYANDAFPISLVSIASHKSVPLQHRQAALLALKTLVSKLWSSSLEEYEGPGTLTDAVKDQVRQAVLAIATADEEERKIIAAASYVVGKIASADFPEQWPSLLPTLLGLVPQAGPVQLYGVLVVLSNLVEDGFDEEQFSTSAAELVTCLYNVAVDGQKKFMTRALAISIFRACFDTMELVYQTNREAVHQFLQQLTDVWTPFFIEIVKMPLPQRPSEEEINGVRSEWQGTIALKTQAVKVCHLLLSLSDPEATTDDRVRLSTRFQISFLNSSLLAQSNFLAPYGGHWKHTCPRTTRCTPERRRRRPNLKTPMVCHSALTFSSWKSWITFARSLARP